MGELLRLNVDSPSRRGVHLRIVRMVCLVMLLSGLALAQRDLGTVTGTVTDPTGSVVPGATVLLRTNSVFCLMRLAISGRTLFIWL